MLKLDESGRRESETAFQMPRRDRFNEDMQQEIKSIRSNSEMKLNSSVAFNRKLRRGQLQNQSKGEKSVNSKSNKGSNRTVTKSLLSRYFKKDDKSAITSVKKHKNQRPMSVDKSAIGSKKMSIMINSNPRYAASKASSIVGCMMGQLKKPVHPLKA